MLVHLLEALKMPNKVMSGYVDECISNIIKNVQFKSAMVLFVNEAKESKAKPMRERCQVCKCVEPSLPTKCWLNCEY